MNLLGTASRGIAIVATRQALVQGLNIAGMAILARELGPSSYGALASLGVLVQFAIALLGSAFASCLIIQKESTVDQESAVFSFQLVAAFIFSVTVSIPTLIFVTDVPLRCSLWLLALSFLLLPFTSVVQAQYEKRMEFGRPAIADVGQALIFNAVALYLTSKNMGVAGCAAAYFSRFLFLFLFMGRRNTFSLTNIALNRSVIKSGMYLQASTTISVVKDAVSPIVLGLLVGITAVGYLNWSNMIAAYPSIILFLLAKIYMPVFSHIRFSKGDIGVAVNYTVQLTNTFVAATAIPTLLLIDHITPIFFGSEWMPAIHLFYFFWVANLFVASVTPLLALLNAYGHERFVFMMCLCWMVFTWGLGAPLCLLYGATGLAIANVVTQMTNCLVFFKANGIIKIKYLKIVGIWILVALTQSLLYFLTPSLLFADGKWLIATMATYIIIGLAVAILAFNRSLVLMVIRNVHIIRSNQYT